MDYRAAKVANEQHINYGRRQFLTVIRNNKSPT